MSEKDKPNIVPENGIHEESHPRNGTLGNEKPVGGVSDNKTSDVTGQNNMASGGREPSPKKDHKRLWITVGVVVGVLVVAAIGFGIWHEQPGFCNAICHSPMDYYVNTYNDRNPNNGITVHAEAGDNCLSCHVPTIAEQLSEVILWTSDNYPMDENGVMLATGKEFATAEFCARSGCHENANNMNEVIAKTWGFEGNDSKYNPHASHQDFALECNDCHGIHDGNVLVCNQCHNLNMPEGWVTPNELMLTQDKANSVEATSSNPESTVVPEPNAPDTVESEGTFDVPDNGEQGSSSGEDGATETMTGTEQETA